MTQGSSSPQQHDRTWTQWFLKPLVGGAVASTTAAVVVSLIYDWETLGAALIVAGLVVPSLAIRLAIRQFAAKPYVADAAYFSSLAPLSVLLLRGALSGSEGSEMARWFLELYLLAAVFGYIGMRWMPGVSNRK